MYSSTSLAKIELLLTQKLLAYVDHWSQGHSRTKAARLAGYADPSHAQADLMQNPRVLRALADAAHDRCVAWRKLLDRAKEGLYYALSPENYMRVGTEDPPVRVSDMLSAVKIVLDTLKRIDPGALVEAAQTEDKAETIDTLARRVIGGHG